MTAETKTCAACAKTEPSSAFPPDKRTADGLDGRCHACHRARWRAYRAANLDAVRARDRAGRRLRRGSARPA